MPGGNVQYALAGLVALFLLALAVGAVTGRIRATSCCAPSDPRRDLRMRGAFEDEKPGRNA
jgi:hypothetical protein